MKLVRIPKGTFMMGSPESEKKRSTTELQHEVTISKDYYLGIYEVTQKQFQKVMGKNPSRFQGSEFQGDGSNYPVELVTWDDAVAFCERLSELPKEKKAGRIYRLPTESEWEYACRAGTKSAYCFGDDPELLGDYAWCGGNSNNRTHPVGEKMQNNWGLYDMHGNVYEWCSDWYGDYSKGSATDPRGPKVGTFRVLRGGHFYGTYLCRAAARDGSRPSRPDHFNGFRIAFSLPRVPETPETSKESVD
jgi:formylglycine-generating enzyme required for sulfatase activity